MSTLPELSDHLTQAGFTEIETYASWDARDAERITGPRLILSAVRAFAAPTTESYIT